MKKLNFSGFAHWIAPALIVAVIGGIGTYMVVGSHADTLGTPASCAKAHGIWKDLTANGVDHGPCWNTPGAYIIDYGKGGMHIDQVPAVGNNPETGNNQSRRYDYPNYVIVVSKNWFICKDVAGQADAPCTSPYFNPMSPGAYNLCSLMTGYTDPKNKNGGVYFDNLQFCSYSNIYIQRA